MGANTWHLVERQAIRKGAPWRLVFVWREKATGNPIDVTDFTAKFQAGVLKSSAEKLIDLNEAEGITVGNTDGKFIIELTAEQTDELNLGTLYYTLELKSSGGIEYYPMEGNIDIILRGIV